MKQKFEIEIKCKDPNDPWTEKDLTKVLNNFLPDYDTDLISVKEIK